MQMNSSPNSGAGEEARDERAVARRQRDATQPRDDEHHRQSAERAERPLHHRRYFGQRELDRDLVEAPAQAQNDHQRDRNGVQRATGGLMLLHGAL